MRVLCYWVGILTACSTTVLSGQQNAEWYPWRASDASRPAVGVPTPPATAASNRGVRLFKSNQDPEAKTERIQDGYDQVPGAPQSTGNNPFEQRPPLDTRSNATDPDYENRTRSSRGTCCQLGDVQRIFGTACNGRRAGGFFQVGIHDSNLPYLNTREERLNLHQVWGFIERPAARQRNGSWGYRIDAVYGIDGPEIQSFGNSPTGAPTGWDNGWDHGIYGWALPQAYIERANSCTSVKIGRFLSPFGAESIPSAENFFYSRTYTRFYTQPFGHTGILATHQRAPGVTLLGGATLGWDTGFDQTDNGFNLLAGLRLQPSQRTSLELTSSLGDTGHRGSGILQSAVARFQVTDRLCYVFAGDFLNLQNNNEFGITNYLFYQINPCLALGTRVEWWKSDQIFGTARSTWDFTTGLNFRPHANFVFRPELRIDYGASAIDSGRLIPAMDAIILF